MRGSQAPAPALLVDDFGREVTGIRVSLTDRCNFDCVYCHNEGLGDTRGPMAPDEDEMDADDVRRLLEVVAEFGVESVKFTGGEPLLRKDLAEIVRGVPEDMVVSLTTNGSLLPDRAQALADAGLERVNVSQDALDPEAFRRLTQSGAYEQVLAGVEAAVDAGLDPVKLNVVVSEDTAGYVPRMVEHVARADALRLQLIEYMPEIAGNPEWAVDIQRVHDWLAEHAHRIEQREMHGRTRYWIRAGVVDGDGVDELAERVGGGTSDRSGGQAASDGVGMVEIVDPVGNAEFCANCHRVRVTPEGEFKGCLNRTDDYRSTGDMTKVEIREAYRETVANRVPYYGEYLVETDEGWERNEDYVS